MTSGGVRDFIASDVEASILIPFSKQLIVFNEKQVYTALFICNLNVIAAAIYHWRRRTDLEEPSPKSGMKTESGSNSRKPLLQSGHGGSFKSKSQSSNYMSPLKSEDLSKMSMSVPIQLPATIQPAQVKLFDARKGSLEPDLELGESRRKSGCGSRPRSSYNVEGGVQVRAETIQWVSSE